MKSHIDLYCNGIAILATVTQADETLRIIQTIITCIGISITIAYNIYKWIKNAKAGKIEDPSTITKSIEDLSNILKDKDKSS